jgi:hypothetical protein
MSPSFACDPRIIKDLSTHSDFGEIAKKDDIGQNHQLHIFKSKKYFVFQLPHFSYANSPIRMKKLAKFLEEELKKLHFLHHEANS